MTQLLRGLSFVITATTLISTSALAQSAPQFANPAEVVRHPDGKLQAVVMLSDADRIVPGLGKKHLRYFQGWDPTKPNVKAPADVSTFSPGPTLRARVGDRVEIMFINTIDDANFPYTRVNGGKNGSPQDGCDAATNLATYPAKDRFPNCFHGSSTGNLHFHGTHTDPDGLGDNVLVQVMPDKNASVKDWAPVFRKVFDSSTIPSRWSDMPAEYRAKQEALVKSRGEGLWNWNAQMIASGQWPQYIVGAYPNMFDLPDPSTSKGKYKAGQSPGTHWYHAHKHGSTSLHSLNGMAGAFIIEGPYDDFLKQFYKLGGSYGDFEKVMVFQLVNPDQNLSRRSINFNGAGPGFALINGLANPTVTMRPGQVQLWRVINATNGATFTGVGPGIIAPTFFKPTTSSKTPAPFRIRQTAKDGVQFSPVNYKAQPFLNGKIPYAANGPALPGAQALTTGLVLAGGNRADVLVQAPATAGTYTFNAGAAAVTVTVAGEPVTMEFPEACGDDITGAGCWPKLPGYLADLPPQSDYPHKVTFGWDPEPGRAIAGGVRLSSTVGLNLPPRYTIDNKQFEQFGPIIDQCMPLDDVQEWILENTTTVTHPFHIHVNPFQVVKVEAPTVNADGTGFTYTTYPGAGDPQNNFVWQDVVPIPAGVTLASGEFIAGRVTIRHHFADFTGTFVLHCHILGHEDRGMMQLVRIVPASKYPGGCQAIIPHHH
jgi:FtsP/CotA-like multicopper oxidase with cupredoxin domain